jgi:hypothetical protein
VSRSTTSATELDRQVENLVARGYPELKGMSPDAFRELLAPLAERVPGSTPFVVVVKVASERALPLVGGFTRMEGEELERFAPIDGVEVPAGEAYLVTDVDTGHATLNVTPDDALPGIVAAGRSPLTISEGVAVLTHDPHVLKEQNAFSLLGSRCGDRRVTALWVSAGKPRLGWCWAGNPHTWLGSASCASRVGA